MFKSKQIFAFAMLMGILSCSKEGSQPYWEITLRLTHKVGKEFLQLQNKKYLNANGDTFTVNQFDYYLSNIKLLSKNTSYSIPNSYHLIRVPSQNHIVELKLKNIPKHEYQALEFGLGVDSIANSKTDKIGDLDPNNPMAWNWLTGYKFVRLEGFHFKKDGTKGGVVFHIGTNPNYRTISLQKPVSDSNTIDIEVDIAKMFEGKNLIDFNKINEAMFGEDAELIAENYAAMFR